MNRWVVLKLACLVPLIASGIAYSEEVHPITVLGAHWNARNALEPIASELVHVGRDLDERFPAEEYFLIGLGRSPYLPLRTLELQHPENIGYLPLSSFRYRHESLLQADIPGQVPGFYSVLGAAEKEMLFRYFDTVIPPASVIGQRQMVLVDYSPNRGTSLSSAVGHLQEYLQVRHRKQTPLRALALISSGPSLQGQARGTFLPADRMHEVLARGITDAYVLPNHLDQALLHQRFDYLAPYPLFRADGFIEGLEPSEIHRAWRTLATWGDRELQSLLRGGGLAIHASEPPRGQGLWTRFMGNLSRNRSEEDLVPLADLVVAPLSITHDGREDFATLVLDYSGVLHVEYQGEWGTLPWNPNAEWSARDGIRIRRTVNQSRIQVFDSTDSLLLSHDLIRNLECRAVTIGSVARLLNP